MRLESPENTKNDFRPPAFKVADFLRVIWKWDGAWTQDGGGHVSGDKEDAGRGKEATLDITLYLTSKQITHKYHFTYFLTNMKKEP